MNKFTYELFTKQKNSSLVKMNPLPNYFLFLCVFCTSLLKTLWEKEKLLVMSNFSFSHSVFNPSGEFCCKFIIFKIVVCKLFSV